MLSIKKKEQILDKERPKDKTKPNDQKLNQQGDYFMKFLLIKCWIIPFYKNALFQG